MRSGLCLCEWASAGALLVLDVSDYLIVGLR